MRFLFAVVLITSTYICGAQTISSDVPQNLNPNERYLFYFHGGVVTTKGDNAINDSAPEWGRYEYSNILDTLRKRGFNVISEMRKKEIDDTVYVVKLVNDVNTLLRKGVPADNIIVVGASAGNYIVLLASARIKNNSLRYVHMGGCWPETYKDYSGIELYGKFLSIIEETDRHQTCYRIFEGRSVYKTFREITLHTGLNHGFIYRGLKEWVDPVVEFSMSD